MKKNILVVAFITCFLLCPSITQTITSQDNKSDAVRSNRHESIEQLLRKLAIKRQQNIDPQS